MALPNIFSRRKRAEERKGSDVYQYDQMPPGARVQFCQIMQDAIGPYGEGTYDKTPGARIYKELVRMMRKEVAVFALPPSGGHYCTPDKEYFDWFLNEPDNARTLDCVELTCRALEVVVEPDKHNFVGT